MAFMKYAKAQVVQPHVSVNTWSNIRTAGDVVRSGSDLDKNLIVRASDMFEDDFKPSDYLLTHATIIASVDTFAPTGSKVGSQLVDGFQVNRKYPDFRITAATDKFTNNNNDAWSRDVLMKSYQTFVGGHNFVEHIQVEELSRGRIIDAVSRDVGDSIYVDILIATDRKHTDLIQAIESGKMATLSMGATVDGTICSKCGHWAADETEMCFPPNTRVLLSDGTYRPIQDIIVGDLVITHTGATESVTEVMSRDYHGDLTVLNVDGVTTPLSSTPNHPYWVLRPAQICACGCGEVLSRTVEHRRGSVKAFQRRFRPGHNSRIRNPNPYTHNVVSQEDYSSVFDVDFEFVKAQDIKKGDYVGFPIPQETVETVDASERKARLIGYFLAEGSYIKRGGVRVGVSFALGYHEENTLVKEIADLLNMEFGREERRISAIKWQHRVADGNIKPIHRRKTSRTVPSDVTCPSCEAPSEYAFNVRFKKGADDCYQCKVCKRQWVQSADRSLQARIYFHPIAGPDTGSITVCMMSVEAADFFYRYCGEYSNEKKIHSDVMKWPSEIQRHVLNCWLNGDGNQSILGVTGNTASFHLVSQMHILAARCGLYARKTLLFGGKSIAHNQVVNGDGSVTIRDGRGWLPSFGLTISDPSGFGVEPRFSDSETARVTMNTLTDSFKRVGNWLIYRVRDTSLEAYCGRVYNFEVPNDHSYVVEGVAVHNCPHIKYEKGNTFFDKQGRQFRVAELCGHESIDPHGGVHFVEASWVEQPAFTGAVLRNVLEPTPITNAKVQEVLASVPTQWSDNDQLKAASVRTDVTAEDTFVQTALVGGIGKTQRSAAYGSADPFLAGWEDEGEVSDTPPAEQPAKSPLEDAEEDLEKHLMDRVVQRMKDKMRDKGLDEAIGGESSMAPNDTLIKEGSVSRMYKAALSTLVKKTSSDADLVNSLADYHQKIGISIPVDLYRASLVVGCHKKYSSVDSFWGACCRVLGRVPNHYEAKTLLRISKLLTQRKSLGSDFQSGSRHKEDK